MRIFRTTFTFVIGVVLSLFSAAATAKAGSIIDLGTLPGGSFSYAYGINASGQVVGVSATASGAQHAFWYVGTNPDGSCGAPPCMTDLGTLGGTNSVAYGINNSGQIVGASNLTGSSDLTYEAGSQAFLYSGGMNPLPLPSGFGDSGAYAINNAGQIALNAISASNGFNRAFLDSPAYSSNLTPFPTLGGSFGNITGINNAALAVGTAYTTDVGGGITHAVLYWDGGTYDLGTLGGAQSSADGINSSGQIVGISELTGEESNSSFAGAHAFLDSCDIVSESISCSGMVDLGTLGGSTTEADGVNDAGQVVGFSDTTGGAQDAFLWYQGIMTDLNTLLPSGSGWDLEEATAINDSGQIVGYGINPEGQTDAFLLDTAPEPTSLVLFGTGTSLLILLRKRPRQP